MSFKNNKSNNNLLGSEHIEKYKCLIYIEKGTEVNIIQFYSAELFFGHQDHLFRNFDLVAGQVELQI